jgi:DNA-binding transcriptional ArsR family regulator
VARTSKLDAVFAALSDPARRAIVERLVQGDANVGTVSKPLRLKPSSVSKHLKVLEKAGIIERRLVGREHWLKVNPEVWRDASDWMARYSQFWRESLDRLDELVSDK